jgi:hypothetical protein
MDKYNDYMKIDHIFFLSLSLAFWVRNQKSFQVEANVQANVALLVSAHTIVSTEGFKAQTLLSNNQNNKLTWHQQSVKLNKQLLELAYQKVTGARSKNY